MSKKIRVLRVMEYIYEDAEAMERDMAQWKVQRQFVTRYLTIKSATLPLAVFPEDDKP